MFWLRVGSFLLLTDLNPLTFECLPAAIFDSSKKTFSGGLFSKIIVYQHYKIVNVDNNMS
jgi:hypothetical protein